MGKFAEAKELLGGSADQEQHLVIRDPTRLSQYGVSPHTMIEEGQLWVAGLVLGEGDDPEIGVNYARLEDGIGMSKAVKSEVKQEYRKGVKSFRERRSLEDTFKKIPFVDKCIEGLQENGHRLLGGYIISQVREIPHLTESNAIIGGIYIPDELSQSCLSLLAGSGNSFRDLASDQLMDLSLLAGNIIARRLPSLRAMRPLFQEAHKTGWSTGKIA